MLYQKSKYDAVLAIKSLKTSVKNKFLHKSRKTIYRELAPSPHAYLQDLLPNDSSSRLTEQALNEAASTACISRGPTSIAILVALMTPFLPVTSSKMISFFFPSFSPRIAFNFVAVTKWQNRGRETAQRGFHLLGASGRELILAVDSE